MSASESAAGSAESTRAMNWGPIAILAAAQFVMVLDSSVMNVSISQIVEDLDTTIQGVQLAITAYTLVMAALMLAGAKLGDILGRDRDLRDRPRRSTALGSLITAISPNLDRPADRLVAHRGHRRGDGDPGDRVADRRHLHGPQRAAAFGIIGGVAGAAIAAGPLIGGWVTTEFSWRYVFAGEVVIVIVILLVRGGSSSSPGARRPAAARRRRRRAVGARPGPRRVRDPQEQRVGADRAARAR